MPNAVSASGGVARSRKKSNHFNQSKNNLDSVLNELSPYIKKASTRISLGLKSSDKDDLAQEARLRLLQVLRRKSDKDLSYFKRAAVNAMFDVYSSEKAGASCYFELDEGDEAISNRANAAIAVDELSTRIAVQNWISKLPARLREVYQFLYIEDYTQREAATRLGISQPRVAQLNEQLKKLGREELKHLNR